jgi:hypothetical protein
VSAMTSRAAHAVQGATIAIVALVLAHNLIFLAGYGAGMGQALAHTGHDDGWTVAVLVSLVLGAVLLATAVGRVWVLRRQARAAGAGRLPSEPGIGEFAHQWLSWWLVLMLAIAALFVVQENLELARVTSQLPGIGVLVSSEYPHALPIICLVALLVSLVAALLGWEVKILTARLVAATATSEAPSATIPKRAAPADRRPGSILGTGRAGRAPPAWLAR